MPLPVFQKTLALGLCAVLSVTSASAQTFSNRGHVIEQIPHAHLGQPGQSADLSHLQGLVRPDLPRAHIPGAANLLNGGGSGPSGGHRGNEAAGAFLGLLAIGAIAGAAAQSNAASSQGLRMQCPAGTQLEARPLSSGSGGVVHNGYRWVCAY